METNEKIESYIAAHSDDEPDYLKHVRRQAHLSLLNPRMISGHVQGRMLKMFVRMICPQRVLEIGTYTGYSALCIAEGLPQNAHIDTIEINDELEPKIRSTFENSAFSQKITLHIGDALSIIPTFPYDFDIIFIDANKRNYIEYYEQALKKVKPKGFIFADNTLWNGHVIEDNIDKNDLQTKGIMDFNTFVKHDTRVEKVMIPIRDGITIIQKV